MTRQAVRRLHQIYGILLSIVTVVAGVCLMVACVSIYQSGEHPYSREAVAAAFAPIAVPVYLCLGMVVAGGLLQLFLPPEEGRLKAVPPVTRTLERLYARTDVTRWDEESRRRVEREQKARRFHRLVTLVLAVISTAVFLAYALNSRHYLTSDVTGSMVRSMYWLLPCTLIPCGYALFARYHAAASLRRELAVLSVQMVTCVVDEDIAVSAGQEETVKAAAAATEEKAAAAPKNITVFPEAAVRYGFLAVGLALLVYGFATGGIADVLTKAVNICTECIGLG